MRPWRRRRAQRLPAAPRFVAITILLAVFGVPVFLPQAAAEPDSEPFLEIRLERVSPESVTTTGPPAVTVSGVVINVGDRPVRDIVARLERAPAIQDSSRLRTDLGGENGQFSPVAEFIDVSTELQRGQEAPFTMTYPLRSGTEPALGFDAPGVYPVLVNVNGTPDYGAPARLDDARFLLPVLGLPAAADAPDDGADDGIDGLGNLVAPDTSRPAPVTMLWPLADRPQLAPGVPGGTSPVRLADDSLATSLAPGGRLDTLLSAAEFATGPTVDPGGEVTRALCLAVDPDLLVTVNAMTGGYVVAESRDPQAAPAQPGAGQAAAVAWLDRLRALARRMCITATPYAQADLDAVDRVGDPNLGTFTTTTVFDLVDQILGVTSARGVTLVGDGSLTDRAVRLLDAHGPTVAIAAADGLTHDEDTGAPATADLASRRLSGQVVAVPFDPTVGAALAALGESPSSPSYLDPSLAVPLDQDAVSRRQDAVSALLWRGLHPDAEPRGQVVMPPLTWDLGPNDAQAILTTLATSIRSGLATPRPLPEVLAAAGAVHGPLQPVSPDADQRGRIEDGVITQLSGQLSRLWGLTAALTTNAQTGLTGVAYTAPLREDMLRALSQSEPASKRNELARRRLDVVGGTIEDLFGAVTIVNPGGAYTLATERSPLPLALRNDLAVPIRVRLDLAVPPGMTVEDIGEQELPPGYLPLRVPIEVHFTQRVAVDASLRTPGGLALGEPVRLSVNSNAYGKVLFIITLSAGAVLFLLTGRRLWHRFRGQPDRADLDRPELTERHEPAEPGRS